jgi:biotin carboxylase
MTQAFKKFGVPIGQRTFVNENFDEKTLEELHYPLVIKPVDAQGQIGTSLIRNQVDLKNAIQLALQHSRGKTVAVEEFIEGPEIAAGAWLVDGKLHLLAVTDRTTYNPPPALGISLQHILPSKAAENNLDQIADILTKVATAYDVTQGPLHAQIVMSPSGPKMMEVGCRYGGANEVDLYKHTLGVDEIELLLDLAFGHPQLFHFDLRQCGYRHHGIINMIVAKAGVLAKHQSMDKLILSKNIIDGGWYRKDGFRQKDITDAYGRIGWFLSTGESREEILHKASEAYSALSVLNESGENLVFWPDQKFINQYNG